jgi:diguanylate cyclase (GGDEF)-like protein
VLATELEVARLEGTTVSVLVADLDRFKAVNNAVGRRGGDELLRRVAESLRDETSAEDVVARTGPTEFTVVLRDRTETDAYLLAEQLLARVRRGFRDASVPLTASIGIATYPAHAGGVDDLLKHAEQALAAAKLLGRDRAVVASDEAQDLLSGSLRRPLEAPAHLATMVSLAEALDLRDATTAEHSRRVGRYAQQIAQQLDLGEYRAERIRLAGILHDIGKVGVRDTILSKPGPLDETEWEEVRRHPELGARILAARELVDIRNWVLASHERPDGKGYPRGLAGPEIPLEARILAVAEAFETMTSDRVYRPALSEAEARRELRAAAGAQFDGEVVEALFAVLDREARFVK